MKKILFYPAITLLIFTLFSCTKEEEKWFEALSFPSEFHFEKFTDKLVFEIKNDGEKSLMARFVLNEFVTNRMGKEQNLTIEAHSTFEMDLEFKRELINTEYYSSTISIYFPALDKEVEIPVSAETVLPEHISLTDDILDAEYLPDENKIVAISNYPDNSLLFIDPTSGNTEKTFLLGSPGFFHVNKNLGKIAISILGRFGIYDIQTKEIEYTSTNIGPYQIFMPNNEFLIAKQDNGVDFGMNLQSGEISFEHYTFTNQLEVHPHYPDRVLASGEQAYKYNLAALDYSSGDLLVNYSVQSEGTEKGLRGKFWIPKNKEWIFGENMGIYKCSANANEDLKYHTSLTEGKQLNTICYFEKFDKYVAIHRYAPQSGHDDQNYFVMYNSNNLSIESKFPVPPFPSEFGKENPERSEGLYLFTNIDESKLFVLTTKPTEVVPISEWELLIYDTNKLFN